MQKNIYNISVSRYDNVFAKSGEPVDLGTFLNDTAYRDKVLEIRAISNKAERDKQKVQLPQVTISGLFDGPHSKENLIKHSGLICVDIDAKGNSGIDDWEYLKRQLAILPQVAFCGLSLSGNGLYCIIPIKFPQLHQQHFKQLQKDFEKMHITIDPACGDVCRLRGMSYDEHPYFNDNAEEYEGFYTEPKKIFPKLHFENNSNNTIHKVQAICRKIDSLGIDLTNDFVDWKYICISLATLGETGREFFHICSRQSTKYDYTKCDKMFTDILDRGYQSVHIGTFFHYCDQHPELKG